MALFTLLFALALLNVSSASNLVVRTTGFGNGTSPTPTAISNPVSSNCCFVVQDIVNEYWWEVYSTEPPYYVVVNLTSITTLITPRISTTVTNFETNVYTTNISIIVTDTVGYNPASLMINEGPQPSQTVSKLVNETQIITAGVTVHSPSAFWIYSSVKIITVPAVTDSSGSWVCQTTSYGTSTLVETISATTETFTDLKQTTTVLAATTTYSYFPFNGGDDPTSNIYIIPGINSNAEAYFGGYSISGTGSNTDISTTGYYTRTISSLGQTETGSLDVSPEVVTSRLWVRSDGETFAYTSPSMTGKVISFPTPFVYFPTRGTTGGSGEVANVICAQTGGNENYGYVPQSVIDHMASVPAISTQFPGIGSCLPGGPSILHRFLCAAAAPTALSALGGDLTSSTIITVLEGNTQIAPNPAQPSATITKNPIPISTSSHIIPAPVVTISPELLSPSSPDSPTHVPTVISPSQINTDGGIGSAIASVIGVSQTLSPMPIPGSVTVISSSTFAVVGPTTIPVNPALSLPGSTTIISNTPFVVISATQTVPIDMPTPGVPSLSGSTTILPGGITAVVVLNGATVPVNSAYTVSGQTTLISGVTEVVVSGTQTFEIPTGISNPGDANTQAPPVQFTGSAGRIEPRWQVIAGIFGAYIWTVITE